MAEPKQMNDSDPACQAFCDVLHQIKSMRPCQPKVTVIAMLVYVHFNIRQQLRRHLDLIDQERRFIPLQKQPRFRHCQAAYVDIVHRHISPVAFCQPAQQSRLSYLTRPRHQKYLTTTAQFFNCRLQMAFDIHRMSSFIDKIYILLITFPQLILIQLIYTALDLIIKISGIQN